jgi:hypothetical protein
MLTRFSTTKRKEPFTTKMVMKGSRGSSREGVEGAMAKGATITSEVTRICSITFSEENMAMEVTVTTSSRRRTSLGNQM